MNENARYKVNDEVICCKLISKKGNKNLKGVVLEIREFRNSLNMKDYKYLIRLENGTERKILERLILCYVA